jgi:hypothetical protein
MFAAAVADVTNDHDNEGSRKARVSVKSQVYHSTPWNARLVFGAFLELYLLLRGYENLPSRFCTLMIRLKFFETLVSHPFIFQVRFLLILLVLHNLKDAIFISRVTPQSSSLPKRL